MQLSRMLRAMNASEGVETRAAVVAALLRASPNDEGTCEVLYVKRRARKSDRWGGQWAFPGGKAEWGETLEETCRREVEEEIGVRLGDREAWLPLGLVGKRRASEKVVVHLAAYLKVHPKSDCCRVTLQPDELSAAVWVPAGFFLTASPEAYRHPKFPLTFPSFRLPLPQGLLVEEPETPLWGLTLAFTQDLLSRFASPSPGLLQWGPLDPRTDGNLGGLVPSSL